MKVLLLIFALSGNSWVLVKAVEFDDLASCQGRMLAAAMNMEAEASAKGQHLSTRFNTICAHDLIVPYPLESEDFRKDIGVTRGEN